MKLLILTPYIPYPVNSGGNQLVFSLIDRLRKRMDISIVLTTKFSGIENAESLKKKWPDVMFFVYDEKNEPFGNVKKPNYYKFLLKAKDSIERKLNRQRLQNGDDYVVRRNSAIYSGFYKPVSERYLDFVASVLKENTFDLIQVEYFDLITLTNIIPADVKKVFVHHELRYIRIAREFSALKHPVIEDMYLKEYSKHIEMQYLQTYDGIITVTDVDKTHLESELGGKIPVYTSPAIVNIPPQREMGTPQFANKIVFLGGTNHYPNKEGFIWFINNCWAKISKQNKNLELRVIGLWPAKVASEYTRRFPNVTFSGYAEDLPAELKNAIMVIPVRIGSGVRIKALDAIVNGVPVVGTSVGVEGLGLTDGEDVFIRDDADGFADAVFTLASDAGLYRQFSNNALKSLEKYKHPDKLAQMRLDIYEDILNATKRKIEG